MSIAEKLTTIAENEQKVYDAGYKAGQESGGGSGGYDEGFADGKQAEYDRFWDSFQQNGEKLSYYAAFSGYGWAEDTLKPKYMIKPIETKDTDLFAAYMFRELGRGSASDKVLFDMTEVCKKVDFSECLSLVGTFTGSRTKNITVNASKAISLRETFRQGNAGTTSNVTLTVSRNCTNYNNAFNYNPMEGFIVTEGSEIAASINLSWATNLSAESMKSIINALVDFTGTDSAYVHNVKFAPAAWATLEADSTAPDGGTWKDYVESIGWSM